MKVSEVIKALSNLDQDLEILINVRDRTFDLDSLSLTTVKDWCDRYKIDYVGNPNQKFIEVLAISQNKVGLPRVPRKNDKQDNQSN